MQKEKMLRVLESFEDMLSGSQLFQIHELDPRYKIDRIVYREKTREGWFKEISSEDYFRKIDGLRRKA